MQTCKQEKGNTTAQTCFHFFSNVYEEPGMVKLDLSAIQHGEVSASLITNDRTRKRRPFLTLTQTRV